MRKAMESNILVYNGGHDNLSERGVMPKLKKTQEENPVGERIAKLRIERGYSQRDLAKETGISHRMIAYYEKQAQHPPTHVMPVLAKALGVTIDQLFGLEKIKTDGKNKDMRLWRRFTQIEKLDAKEKRQVIQLLDTFIEKEQLKQKAQG
jgi:transcriptional regulator with XRE-family HTH domain